MSLGHWKTGNLHSTRWNSHQNQRDPKSLAASEIQKDKRKVMAITLQHEVDESENATREIEREIH